MSDHENDKTRFPAIDDITSRLAVEMDDDGSAYEAIELGRQGGRERTRFLNFKKSQPMRIPGVSADDLARLRARSRGLATLTITDGPGEGKTFAIDKPVVNIGRGDSQDIQINFGDDAISREGHASIAYYGRGTGFVIRDGLKPNPVFLNDRPLQVETTLDHGDVIQIGETLLVFGRV